MDLMTLVSQVVVGVTIGTVASVVTVRLSLQRFRTERWWERTAEVYTSLLEALHHRRTHLQAVVGEVQEGRTMTDERREELVTKSAEAARELERLQDLGTLFVSREAETILREMAGRISQAHALRDWHEGVDMELGVLESGLARMRVAAKRHLRV